MDTPASPAPTAAPTNGAATVPPPAPFPESPQAEVRRGRGRPPGSRNKTAAPRPAPAPPSPPAPDPAELAKHAKLYAGMLAGLFNGPLARAIGPEWGGATEAEMMAIAEPLAVLIPDYLADPRLALLVGVAAVCGPRLTVTVMKRQQEKKAGQLAAPPSDPPPTLKGVPVAEFHPNPGAA